MKTTRAIYHQCVKEPKRDDNKHGKQRFAESIAQNDQRTFWVEVTKMASAKKGSPSTVDNFHTATDICQSFASQYNDLYNLGDTCTVQNRLDNVRRDIRRRITSDDNHIFIQTYMLLAFERRCIN